MTNVVKRWPALLAVCGLMVVLCASTAHAQQMSVKPVSPELAVQGSTLQATFKIEVVNSESSAMTNFFVFFEDGTYVSLGDVNAGATVVSDSVTRLIDLTDRPTSRSVSIEVTLKFSIDGQDVERTWPVALTSSEAE